MKLIKTLIVILGTFLFCPCKSQDILLKSKGLTIGPNLFYSISPGGGWGIEGGFPILKKARNISLFAGYDQFSTTSEQKPYVWNSPKIQRIKCGIRYFPGIKLYRGFFTGESIDYTTGSYKELNSGSVGTFENIGFIFELGVRAVFLNHFFIQGSFGVGWSFSISDSFQSNTTNIVKPVNDGLNGDGTVILGFYF